MLTVPSPVSFNTPHRVDIFEGAEGSLGAVDLSVDVQGANHRRALFNMLLSLVFILVLLAFVCTLNYSIWQVRVRAGGVACLVLLGLAGALPTDSQPHPCSLHAHYFFLFRSSSCTPWIASSTPSAPTRPRSSRRLAARR